MTEEGVLSSSQLSQLKELLAAKWTDEKTDACDGAVWSSRCMRMERSRSTVIWAISMGLNRLKAS